MDQFFVTLPSNASGRDFPDNTKSNFITQLYSPLDFKIFPYEVALVEMTTSGQDIIEDVLESWAGTIFINMTLAPLEEIAIDVYLKDLHLKNLAEICSFLNQKIQDATDTLKDRGFKTWTFSPKFKYSKRKDRKGYMEIGTMPGHYSMYMIGVLTEFLGFPETKLNAPLSERFAFGTDYKCQRPFNFELLSKYTTTGMPSTLYVYTDVCKYQLVGDSSSQLLRTVYIDPEKNYKSQCITYDSPHYIPVSENFIDSIQITIKNDQNEFVHFSSGTEPNIIKLHFRPRIRHGL